MTPAASAELTAFVRGAAEAHARPAGDPAGLGVAAYGAVRHGGVWPRVRASSWATLRRGHAPLHGNGCDWGAGNIFFFSKLCLLISLNVVFVIVWFRAQVRPVAFVPHLAVLLIVAAVFNTDLGCGDYYGHPNGTTGQMIVEAVAFIVMGLAFTLYRDGRWATLLGIGFVWNACTSRAFTLQLLPRWLAGRRLPGATFIRNRGLTLDYEVLSTRLPRRSSTITAPGRGE